MKIESVYVDQEVASTPIAKRVLEKLKDVPVYPAGEREDVLKKLQLLGPERGKKTVWLTSQKGAFLKSCPGTTKDYLCCGYWVINAQTNCPLDCSYCILQQYLNVPVLKIFCNADRIQQEIQEVAAGRDGRIFRIGTGELTDSLALEYLTGFSSELMQSAENLPVLIEFKTKTACVQDLPICRNGRAVISWSLNPPAYIRSEEKGSASLESRLSAAKAAVAKGYRLGFHFDPILLFEDWQSSYFEVFRRLTEEIDEKDVVWISFGSLRFPSEARNIIRSRFPESKVLSGELTSGMDGKMRYFRPVRTEVYQTLYRFLREKWPNVWIYFCMENETVWRQVMGFAPNDQDDLDRMFDASLRSRFPDYREL